MATLAGTTYRRAARYGNYSRLGGGPAGNVVFAGDLFGVYRQRDGRITALKTNLEVVGDLDQRDGWAVAVGLSRLPEPTPGPDDIWEPYIAWLFDAEDGILGLLPTRDGGVALDACYPVELSVGRFVADDLVLVIPGAEPGVFVYGTDGVLRGAMGVGAFSASRPDCGPEQKDLLYEGKFRIDWLSRHRVIDEVAANGEGDVFFFVRHVDGGEPVASASTNGSQAPGVPGREARKAAADGESSGVSGRESIVVALGFDSLPASEVEELAEEAASHGGRVALTGEQAAQLLAAASSQAGVGGSERLSVDTVPSVPRAKVCWDIVHAQVDDLRRVSTSPCAVTSELADARLRADVSGDRAVLLIRGATRLASGPAERPADLFEARLRPGS
ncbi:MAG: hypothetical protein OXG74_02825 [Acidobacteria bacterium]|nr:hypothetical protein [Acidobacteriota bacterium]